MKCKDLSSHEITLNLYNTPASLLPVEQRISQSALGPFGYGLQYSVDMDDA